jgi:hypothetical protein
MLQLTLAKLPFRLHFRSIFLTQKILASARNCAYEIWAGQPPAGSNVYLVIHVELALDNLTSSV